MCHVIVTKVVVLHILSVCYGAYSWVCKYNVICCLTNGDVRCNVKKKVVVG